MEQGTHYRTGGKLTHAGCEMLPNGQDIPYIVISEIEFKENEMINGRSEQGVWIAHFAANPYTRLPMILNMTNRKRIWKLYPQCEGYIDRLHDIAVRLTKEKCRDVQDGGETWGLRISKMPAKAPAKPTFDINDKEIVKKAIAFLKADGSVDAIKSKYTLTEDTVNALVKMAMEEE